MSDKTGTLGRPWVELEKPRPKGVDDHYAYWADPPPERSNRCAYWLRQIERGWIPNRHWRAWSYDEASEILYGVYIWEFVHEISPAVSRAVAEARAR